MIKGGRTHLSLRIYTISMDGWMCVCVCPLEPSLGQLFQLPNTVMFSRSQPSSSPSSSPPFFQRTPPPKYPSTSTVAPACELTHKTTVPPQQMEMMRQ